MKPEQRAWEARVTELCVGKAGPHLSVSFGGHGEKETGADTGAQLAQVALCNPPAAAGTPTPQLASLGPQPVHSAPYSRNPFLWRSFAQTCRISTELASVVQWCDMVRASFTLRVEPGAIITPTRRHRGTQKTQLFDFFAAFALIGGDLRSFSLLALQITTTAS